MPNTSSKLVVTAALAAAAAAISACTGPAAHTAAPAPVAISPTTASVQHVKTPPDWTDVSGGGVVVMDNSSVPTQYGASPQPGRVILSGYEPGSGWGFCTLGSAIRRVDGGRDGFLTAGHCGESDPSQRLQASATLAGPATTVILGDVSDAQHDVIDPATSTLSDSAAVWSGATDSASVRIAGTWPVAGVMTLDAIKKLPMGTSVCYNGARSGVKCGPLVNGDENGQLEFLGLSQKGDSGSPVFLVDKNTGAATLVGILQGGDKAGSTFATYLEPALTRLHAVALVDPTASAFASGPDYSTRVAPLQ